MAFSDSINVMRLTAHEMQEFVTAGYLTSEQLVKEHIKQIEAHNEKLCLLIEVCPMSILIERARRLDRERAHGLIRGPLHGIPIIVKVFAVPLVPFSDNFVTEPRLGLSTTGGSFAFMDLQRHSSAECVRKMIEAGCIILGKSNLSEFANFKGTQMPCGWSARGGQSQSPYVKGGWDLNEKFGGHSGPGGSSSGSAASVAAGFAPIALGTETWGSLIMPASRANVFTLKPSRGLVAQDGIMPVSEILDTAGPMTKSAIDIANSLDIVANRSPGSQYPAEGLRSKVTGSWDGLRLGTVRTSDWRLSEKLAEPDDDWFKQQEHDLDVAYEKLRNHGVSIKGPIDFPGGGPLADIMSDLISQWS
ncbi:MAG: hypothetical protein Q9220_005991 [cf. Caloplaca sp. 1 TL-2023]